MKAKALVVGIGNPFLGADAFGPAVVAALGACAALPTSTDLLDAHTDLLAVIDRFAAYRHVVIVDAIMREGSGQVNVLDESLLAAADTTSTSAHQVSAALAVGLFRRLNPAAATRITLVGLDVSDLRADVAPAPDTIDEAVLSIVRLLAA